MGCAWLNWAWQEFLCLLLLLVLLALVFQPHVLPPTHTRETCGLEF